MMRFCPACGGRLPQAKGIRYCMHCGQKLEELMPAEDSLFSATVADPGESTAATLMHSYAPPAKDGQDTAACQESLPGESPAQTVASGGLSKLRTGSAATATPAVNVAPRRETVDWQYSVVLKSITDKERLIGLLSRVLNRGLTATRMAVELVPGVILYKSGAKDICLVIDILNAEGSYYTVIQGDFDMKLSLHERIPDFARLDGGLQQLLTQVPAGLWLGETVQFVIDEVVWENDSHVLVVTDQALYLISRPGVDKPLAWRIIPFSQLANVVLHAEDEELECMFKEYGREECLQIPDQADLTKVYHYVSQLLAK